MNIKDMQKYLIALGIIQALFLIICTGLSAFLFYLLPNDITLLGQFDNFSVRASGAFAGFLVSYWAVNRFFKDVLVHSTTELLTSSPEIPPNRLGRRHRDRTVHVTGNVFKKDHENHVGVEDAHVSVDGVDIGDVRTDRTGLFKVTNLHQNFSNYIFRAAKDDFYGFTKKSLDGLGIEPIQIIVAPLSPTQRNFQKYYYVPALIIFPTFFTVFLAIVKPLLPLGIEGEDVVKISPTQYEVKVDSCKWLLPLLLENQNSKPLKASIVGLPKDVFFVPDGSRQTTIDASTKQELSIFFLSSKPKSDNYSFQVKDNSGLTQINIRLNQAVWSQCGEQFSEKLARFSNPVEKAQHAIFMLAPEYTTAGIAKNIQPALVGRLLATAGEHKSAAIAYAQADFDTVVNFSKDDPSSLLELGKYYEEKGQFENAIKSYNLAIDDKNGEAAYLLGSMYLNGRGVEQNKNTACDLYRQAQALGYSEASQALATQCVVPSRCPLSVGKPAPRYIYSNGGNPSDMASDNRSGWESISQFSDAQQYVSVKTYDGPDCDPKNPSGMSIVFRFDFSNRIIQQQGWLGAAFLSERGCFGDKTDSVGHPLPCVPSYDLSRYRSLVFRVKGDNGQKIEVKSAHAQGNMACGDSTDLPIVYPQNPIILTNNCSPPIRIPLHGNTTRIITPFTIIAHPNPNNPASVVTVYVDDIHYE